MPCKSSMGWKLLPSLRLPLVSSHLPKKAIRKHKRMELNSYFRGLLSSIEPDTKAVKAAKCAHEELRSILQADEDVSEAEPDSYLSGSYARDTAIKNIKDVDIIVLLDVDP